jgi:hypothetical protein
VHKDSLRFLSTCANLKDASAQAQPILVGTDALALKLIVYSNSFRAAVALDNGCSKIGEPWPSGDCIVRSGRFHTVNVLPVSRWD